MAVVIGIDPHKQSHQAVALDHREEELSRLELTRHDKGDIKLLTQRGIDRRYRDCAAPHLRHRSERQGWEL